MKVLLVLIATLALLTSCSTKQTESNNNDPNYQAFSKYTAEKDSLFRFADWSPIPAETRNDFAGLNYFEYNPELHFEGNLVRYDSGDSTVIYATREGDIRPALKYGYFPFTFRDKEFRLEVFKMGSKSDPSRQHLFLGFTDATGGNLTYGGGRYIDIEENAQNYYVVDFNYAYNPYCAYNHRYSCAVPPSENRLPFPVLAGEKLYEKH